MTMPSRRPFSFVSNYVAADLLRSVEFVLPRWRPPFVGHFVREEEEEELDSEKKDYSVQSTVRMEIVVAVAAAALLAQTRR